MRPSFPILEDGTMLPGISSSLPTRPGLDIGEKSTSKLPQQYADPKAWKARPPQPQQQHPRLRSESPREELPFPVKELQVGRQEEDWILVSSPAETESNTLLQHGYVRYVPPGPYITRSKAQRHFAPPSRHVVPLNYFVTWKGEEGGIRKNGVSSTSPTTRLGKSMENIRAATQRPDPLPVSHGPLRDNYYNDVVAGLSKSYEPSSRAIRPQGSMHSPSLDLSSRPTYSYHTSLSTNDFLARPQSASGENATPTSTSLRHPTGQKCIPSSFTAHSSRATLSSASHRHL